MYVHLVLLMSLYIQTLIDPLRHTTAPTVPIPTLAATITFSPPLPLPPLLPLLPLLPPPPPLPPLPPLPSPLPAVRCFLRLLLPLPPSTPFASIHCQCRHRCFTFYNRFFFFVNGGPPSTLSSSSVNTHVMEKNNFCDNFPIKKLPVDTHRCKIKKEGPTITPTQVAVGIFTVAQFKLIRCVQKIYDTIWNQQPTNSTAVLCQKTRSTILQSRSESILWKSKCRVRNNETVDGKGWSRSHFVCSLWLIENSWQFEQDVRRGTTSYYWTLTSHQEQEETKPSGCYKGGHGVQCFEKNQDSCWSQNTEEKEHHQSNQPINVTILDKT